MKPPLTGKKTQNRSVGPRLFATLVVCLLVTTSACKGPSTEGVDASPVETATAKDANRPHELAGTLIQKIIEYPNSNHVAVEINLGPLNALTTTRKFDSAVEPFRDPLQAARLFAPHIGLSANADFALTQQSGSVEDGSGLFIALVKASSNGQTLLLRMVSEPDAYDQPTLWVLNDYTRLK